MSSGGQSPPSLDAVWNLLFEQGGGGGGGLGGGGHGGRGRDLVGGRILDLDREALVGAETGTGRDEPTHDDVLLEAAQVVDLAADRGLGEHLGGFLERRGRDEALRRERRLGDPEEQRLAVAGLAALGDHALVLLFEHVLLHV